MDVQITSGIVTFVGFWVLSSSSGLLFGSSAGSYELLYVAVLSRIWSLGQVALIPTNKLEILTPYIALIGLVAVVSAVAVVKRRRD